MKIYREWKAFAERKRLSVHTSSVPTNYDAPKKIPRSFQQLLKDLTSMFESEIFTGEDIDRMQREVESGAIDLNDVVRSIWEKCQYEDSDGSIHDNNSESDGDEDEADVESDSHSDGNEDDENYVENQGEASSESDYGSGFSGESNPSMSPVSNQDFMDNGADEESGESYDESSDEGTYMEVDESYDAVDFNNNINEDLEEDFAQYLFDAQEQLEYGFGVLPPPNIEIEAFLLLEALKFL